MVFTGCCPTSAPPSCINCLVFPFSRERRSAPRLSVSDVKAVLPPPDLSPLSGLSKFLFGLRVSNHFGSSCPLRALLSFELFFCWSSAFLVRVSNFSPPIFFLVPSPRASILDRLQVPFPERVRMLYFDLPSQFDLSFFFLRVFNRDAQRTLPRIFYSYEARPLPIVVAARRPFLLPHSKC